MELSPPCPAVPQPVQPDRDATVARPSLKVTDQHHFRFSALHNFNSHCAPLHECRVNLTASVEVSVALREPPCIGTSLGTRSQMGVLLVQPITFPKLCLRRALVSELEMRMGLGCKWAVPCHIASALPLLHVGRSRSKVF